MVKGAGLWIGRLVQGWRARKIICIKQARSGDYLPWRRNNLATLLPSPVSFSAADKFSLSCMKPAASWKTFSNVIEPPATSLESSNSNEGGKIEKAVKLGKPPGARASDCSVEWKTRSTAVDSYPKFLKESIFLCQSFHGIANQVYCTVSQTVRSWYSLGLGRGMLDRRFGRPRFRRFLEHQKARRQMFQGLWGRRLSAVVLFPGGACTSCMLAYQTNFLPIGA